MLVVVLVLGGAMGLASCSQTLSAGAKSGKGDTRRAVEVVHEACDVGSSSAIKQDANGDGRPELITVNAGGQLHCRAMDLNNDGLIDRYAYYDGSGQLRRVESDYDRDGKFDEIALYQGGVLVEKHREMNLDGKLDAWVYYENNTVTKQERDTDGDGRVDEWWQYSPPKEAGEPPCVVVSRDIDGDGLPEPASQIDSCKPPADALAPGAIPIYDSASAAPPPPPPSALPPPPPPSPAPGGP
jgi:hypothetical protein